MTFSMKHRKKMTMSPYAAIKKHRVDVQNIGLIFNVISDYLLIFCSIEDKADSVSAPNSAHQRKPLVK